MVVAVMLNIKAWVHLKKNIAQTIRGYLAKVTKVIQMKRLKRKTRLTRETRVSRVIRMTGVTRVIGATTVNKAVVAPDSLPPSDMAAWRVHLSGRLEVAGNRQTADRNLITDCYT